MRGKKKTNSMAPEAPRRAPAISSIISVRAFPSRPLCCGARRGFLMTLEALSAVALLIIASAAMGAFAARAGTEGDFFLCSDAAVVLSKSGFSPLDLQQRLSSMHSLTGMCVKAESAFASASSPCTEPQGKTLAFSIPAWGAGSLQSATVSCWREK